MCVWPVQSDCKSNYLHCMPKKTNKHFSSGSVKNLSPGPIMEPADSGGGRGVPPWISRTTAFPPSYILTEAPRSPTLNLYKPTVECPPSQSWRIPDPYDCSVYHDCYHGTDLVSYCPAQLFYNPKIQTCDYAQNVQCNSKRNSLKNEFIQFCILGKNKCTVKNEGVRFVDLYSCCHYYECVSGKLVSQTCPHPNSFDVQTRTCLPYKKVKCDGRRQCLSKCKRAR